MDGKKKDSDITRCVFKTSVWRYKLLRISALVADDTGHGHHTAHRINAKNVDVNSFWQERAERPKNFSYNVKREREREREENRMAKCAVSTIIRCISKRLNGQTLNL